MPLGLKKNVLETFYLQARRTFSNQEGVGTNLWGGFNLTPPHTHTNWKV